MPFSRRDFLRSGFAVAVAALGAFALKGTTQNSASASHKPGHVQFVHRGRKVTIDETNRGVDVTIDGVHQHHIAKKVPRRGPPFFASHLLPFENYTNAGQLVKALIDAEIDLELFILN